MKRILLAALAVTVMASCSKDETTGIVAPKGIDFGVVKGNSVITKATTTNLTESDKLGVYAFSDSKAYDGIGNLLLAYDKQAKKWLLPNVHYFPITGTDVSFWAYGPYNDSSLGGTVACDAVKGPNFTLALTNKDTKVDIWATTKAETGSKTKANAITFALKRVLAQVKFQAYTTDAANTISKISSITVTAKGKAGYADSKWGTPEGDNITWTSLSKETEITAGSSADITDALPLNLIPKDQAAVIKIKAKIYSKSGTLLTEVAKEITIGGKDYPYWAEGKLYTYVIKIDPTQTLSPVTFGVPKVENWDPVKPDVEIPVTSAIS